MMRGGEISWTNFGDETGKPVILPVQVRFATLVASNPMPSGCPRCTELAEVYFSLSSKIQWIIGQQKLNALRHDFKEIHSFDSELSLVVQKRNLMSQDIESHLAEHTAEKIQVSEPSAPEEWPGTR